MLTDQPALFAGSAGRTAPAVTAPSRTDLHIRIRTLPAGGGRMLRVAAVDDQIVIALGFADDALLRTLAGGVSLSSHLWPDLRREIDALLDSAQ